MNVCGSGDLVPRCIWSILFKIHLRHIFKFQKNSNKFFVSTPPHATYAQSHLTKIELSCGLFVFLHVPQKISFFMKLYEHIKMCFFCVSCICTREPN
jgi:hypothetical protein